MLWINTMKIYTCTLLVFVTQVVFTEATCISKTATEFDNNCYEFITTRMTLIEAQKYCSNFNGTRILAKVSSPSVLDFLNTLRKNNEFVWLGANDTLHNGEWVWVDGTKANLTSMWNEGEPNNQSGIEHCLQIYYNGKLNDMPCDETISTAFICMEVHECISKTATIYDNNCYELFTTPKNWTEAKRYCSNFNGTRILAKVSSPSVLRYFNSLRPSYTRVWLGGNDQLQEDEWVWTDGTKADLTSMWGYTEPNNLGGNEDCLEIFNDGTLNDDDCAQHFSFICMEVRETTATPKTYPTLYPTSTATLSFTTARNESKVKNVSSESLECISKTATMFDNNCYELFTNEMTWNEAKRYCSNFNGTRTLAKVSSPSVLRYFISILPSSERVWLGASDQLQEGEWLWTDGTKADLTSMWEAGEPNNFDGIKEDCLDIFETGNLNDEACSLTLPFICMEVHETTATPKTSTEKMYSFGQTEWIGIETSFCILVMCLLLAVLLAIKYRCEIRSLSGKLKEFGYSTINENQIKQSEDCRNITLSETVDVQQVEIYLTENVYADCFDYQGQNSVYDNMTQTETGRVLLVDLDHTENVYADLYADFFDQQGSCNS